jgi:Tfp pilus assembly protein FimT
MHQRRLGHGEAGASLIELVIVLVVAAILITAAVTRLASSKEIIQRQNIAREFKVYLERARFDSMKRRANLCHEMARVTINSGTSFSVTTDSNQNGQLDLPGEVSDVNLGSGRSNVQMIGSGITLPATIRFDERGRALLTDCVTAAPTTIPLLYFCDGACTTATVNDQNASALFISAAGTISMLTGSATAPSFSNPTVTNINSDVQVNPQLSVWTPTAPVTPTPTPTPASTPTPTPTPVARTCIGSPFEKPAETGCNCLSPMWVRSNGFCK